jgi:hypothetical protein
LAGTTIAIFIFGESFVPVQVVSGFLKILTEEFQTIRGNKQVCVLACKKRRKKNGDGDVNKHLLNCCFVLQVTWHQLVLAVFAIFID